MVSEFASRWPYTIDGGVSTLSEPAAIYQRSRHKLLFRIFILVNTPVSFDLLVISREITNIDKKKAKRKTMPIVEQQSDLWNPNYGMFN